jgi:hypothetical protein
VHYARPHVKRYWVFAFRRAIGASMIMFGIALAIGLAFTSVFSGQITNSLTANLVFWSVLMLITVLVLLASLLSAHKSSIRFLNEEEHIAHSKYFGIWLISLVVGAVAFTLPILFFNSQIGPLILLFSFGGVYWVVYISIGLLFRHLYHELAIGGLASWIMFVIGVLGASSVSSATTIYSLFISSTSLIIISSVIGLAMMYNSSKEFESEFAQSVGSNEKKQGKKAKRKR